MLRHCYVPARNALRLPDGVAASSGPWRCDATLLHGFTARKSRHRPDDTRQRPQRDLWLSTRVDLSAGMMPEVPGLLSMSDPARVRILLTTAGRGAGLLGGASAVDGQRRTGDEGGFVAEQEGDERRDLIWL